MAEASVVKVHICAFFFFLEVCPFLVKAQIAICQRNLHCSGGCVTALFILPSKNLHSAHGELHSLYRESTRGKSGTGVWPPRV